MAVGNLTYKVQDPGNSVSITWDAPFSRNITDTEPDITYCIEISSETGLRSMHAWSAHMHDLQSQPIIILDLHFRRECDIVATTYSLIIQSENFSPCSNRFNVTVIPVNGLLMNNNGTKKEVEIYLYDGMFFCRVLRYNSLKCPNESNNLS